jgi:hypothetical protein
VNAAQCVVFASLFVCAGNAAAQSLEVDKEVPSLRLGLLLAGA